MFTTLNHWLNQVKSQAKIQAQTQVETQAKALLTPLVRSLAAPLTVMLLLAQINPAHAATASRASAFEYDAVSGLLTKEIIEPDNSDLCLVTTYTYDSFGNKTGATTRNCNGSAGSNPGTNSEAAAPVATSVAVIETRTSTTTYDSQGRFPTTSTNALGQAETKTYNPNFGTVATLTGPNALTTSWTYDSFGKPLTESRADSTSTSTAYALCDVTCPTVGTAVAKYTITTTQAGAPYSKTYYDMNGRAIQTETQDKGGALILSQVQFDNLGRTIKTSRPFKSGATPVWNTVAYDKLNRAITNTAPNGAVTSVTYDGYTTTTTVTRVTPPNSNTPAVTVGLTKTEVKNSQGQLVTVTDAQAKTMSYQYDAFGNLTTTTDALANVTTITYDARGRKVAMNDPDQGVWSYQYDALGQLKKQTDAKLQNVSFVYDKLGRMTSRAEPDLISKWYYDTCDATLNSGAKCTGKLVRETSDNGITQLTASDPGYIANDPKRYYVRVNLYDTLGRFTGEASTIDSATNFGVTKSFDALGRVASLTYPGETGINFSTHNVYSTTTGHLIEIHKQNVAGALLWTAGATDNEGRVTNTTYGNGVTNTTTIDPLTGRIVQMAAGTSNSVSNQSFVYDNIGNLIQRYDGVTGLNEAFAYDTLNRLTSTSAQAGTGPITPVTVAYNAIGNIMSKSDIGTYTYASLKANGTARPHAVSQIMMNDGVTVYGAYTYDANGNQLTGAGRTMTWNSWNMPTQVIGTKPAGTNVNLPQNTPVGTTSSSFQFVYNAAHERLKETLPNGTVIYNVSPRLDTGIHVEKRVKPSGEVQYSYSLYAGSMPFGMHSETKLTPSSAATSYDRYFHVDHLGSIVAITDQNGGVVERRSYDAWGKRRNLNGTSLANAFVTSDVRHAFTGHEDMGEVGLIHMNGRLYDPATGRFISADPTIQYPDDMQNYNRYSYINNNPLSATDPSGYGFFKSLKKAFKGVVKAVKSVLSNKIVRLVATVVAAYYGGVFAGDLFAGSAAFSGLSGAAYNIGLGVATGAGAGFAGGFVASGGNIKSALTGAVAGAVTGGVAGYYGSEYTISRVFSNGVANGVSAKIQGGNFMDGLRSGLMTSVFTYGNMRMRNAMIENSKINRVIDGVDDAYNDGSGYSKGMFGDLFKLAGGRFNEFAEKTEACSPLG
ncbi:MAG: RHS repeat-associated core domain-containing protein, partial [Methylococcales bacterium]